MKRIFFLLFFALFQFSAWGQCAMCTKTAAGLDENSARGLNSGIIFLAFTPLIMIGIFAIIWIRKHKSEFFKSA